MKVKILLIILFLASNEVLAQRKCGSELNLESIRQNNPEHYNMILQLENKISNSEINSLSLGSQVITIPVVVHVLHTGYPIGIGDGLNISKSQIQSQIDVLNEDFRRLNANASETPSIFQAVAADVQIEFVLACIDPNGNPTDGIVRKQTSVNEFYYEDGADSTANEAAIGIKFEPTGSPAWPTDRYLNIWVCKMGGGFLGYAQYPYLFDSRPETDGVVVNTTSFGRDGYVTAPYNKGRTATHEVGHWLNLYHIWGSLNGGCDDDDEVSDTPNQQGAYISCPSFPQSTCGSDDMFMNYMDYSPDACMNLFTEGQKNRMLATFSTGEAREKFLTKCYLEDYICSEVIKISGSSFVCTANSTFTLGDVPASASVNWIVSDNNLLTIVSSDNSSATIKAATSSSSGSGWVKAEISTDCQSRSETANFWVGPPSAVLSPITQVGPFGGVCVTKNIPYDISCEVYSVPGATDVEWRTFPAPSGLQLSWGYSGGGIHAVINADNSVPSGCYDLYVEPVNDCGMSLGTAFTQIEVANSWGCSSCGGGPMFLSHPNPVNDELTISLSEEGKLKVQEDRAFEYQIIINDEHGKEIYNQCHKELITKIDMRGYRRAYYRLVITYKGEDYQHKILKQ